MSWKLCIPAGAAAGAIGMTLMRVEESRRSDCGFLGITFPWESKSSGSRKYVFGGNWKCNGDVKSVDGLVETLGKCGPIPANAEVMVAPPFLHVPIVTGTIRPDIAVGGQNVSLFPNGARTGEISAAMMKDMGVSWVIVGHSERREGFGMAGESSELVALKTKVAVSGGLSVMACVGEKLEERDAGKTLEVCYEQLKPLATKLNEDDWANVVIAYEPVWAIGTGRTATPEQAQEVHKAIRDWLAKNVSDKVAAETRIVYGGSMKGKNAPDLLKQPDIDGGLIGGASLKAEFFDIVNATPSK